MEKKQIKKEFSRIGITMAIAAIGITILQMGGQMLALMIRPEWEENYDILVTAGMLPLFLIAYPLTILALGRKGMTEIEKHTMSVKEILLAFMMSYGILVIGNWLGIGVTTVISFVKGGDVTNPLLEVVTGGNVWITSIYTVILAPIFEEIIFRKILCGKMIKYGEGVAIVTSALMFGLFHGNLNQFFYALFMGFFFAYIYVKTGNIKYTIILHMMVNALGSLVSVLVIENLDIETTFGLAGMAAWSICIYAIAIIGLVMCIRKRKTLLTLEAGDVIIEKKQRFRTVICNPGMIIYCGIWIAVMIIQAFAA